MENVPQVVEQTTSVMAAIPVLAWDRAPTLALAARKAREKMISSVLKANLDFGVIPGTDKPTLLKAGAEKIADSLDLYPEYRELAKLENFEDGVFFYRYCCELRQRGSGALISTGIGSANSKEARYRWRNAPRLCPVCGADKIIKGREEYGGGWLCYKKKGGCGAKFPDNDERITGQGGKVENDDPYTLTNTIDKMAQKRALVAASLNLGFSEHFTQDLEDMERLEPQVSTKIVAAEEAAVSFDSQTQEELETVARSITTRLASSEDGVIQKGVKEWRDLSNDEKTAVWAMLDKPTRKALKALTQPKYDAIDQAAAMTREQFKFLKEGGDASATGHSQPEVDTAKTPAPEQSAGGGREEAMAKIKEVLG